jgi:O-antigen ligase
MRLPMGIEFLKRQAHSIALGLVGAMFCVPFLISWHRYPLTSFFTELVAAVLGLAASVLLLRKRYWQPWQFPIIGLLPLGLVLLLILQIVTVRALFPQQNLLAALFLLWACCMIMLGAVLRQEFELQKIVVVLCRFTLAAGVLSSLIGIQQFFQLHTFFDTWLTIPVSNRLVANLGQANHLGNLLALGLISLIYLRARGELSMLGALISALLLLFVMGFTGSRSTWLYLVSIALTAMWGGRREKSGQLIIAAWLLLPSYLLVQWAASLAIGHIEVAGTTSTDRLWDLTQVEGMSVRWYLWRHAWATFLDAPLMGAGFGSFAWTMFDAIGLSQGRDYLPPYSHAHNLVMNLLVEMGLLAALLACVLPFALFWRLVKSGYSREHWWLLTVATVLAIHSMFEYPLWYAHFLGIAAILAGLSETTFRPLQIRFGRAVIFTMLLIGGFSLIKLTRDYVRVESVFASSALLSKDPLRMSADLQTMADIGSDSLLAPYALYVVAAVLKPDPAHLREQLEVSELVQRLSPGKYIVFKYAVLLALAGESDRAEQQMRKAMLAYPEYVPEVIGELKGAIAEGSLSLNPLLNLLAQKSLQKN